MCKFDIPNVKQFGCSYCGKLFVCKEELFDHINVHVGITPHKCDQCSESFSHRDVLKEHIESHSNVKKPKPVIKCDICDYTFSKLAVLKAHNLRYHTPAPPLFDAEEKPAGTAGKSDKKISEKPAGNAGKTKNPAGTTGKLKEGTKKPEGTARRPVKDTKKPAVTARKSARTGVKKKPEFKCKGCNKIYSHAPSLKRHLKKAH